MIRTEESGSKFDGKAYEVKKFANITDMQTFASYIPPIKGLTKKKIRTKLKHVRKEFKTH